MPRHLERFGVDAILVTDPGMTGDEIMAALEATPGVLESVPGACSLLLRFPDWDAAGAAISFISSPSSTSPSSSSPSSSSPSSSSPGNSSAPRVRSAPPAGDLTEIPLTYDGIDLDAVAAHCGLSRQEVIDLHARTTFRVAFCGFAPGFAYLAGLPAQLRVPRLPTPRTAVPAGAVAIADGYCGIYPRSTPGGWRIIGHTDLVLFEESRRPPALLTPGMTVRFTPDGQ
jgi:KipI family sensor histidine kinase inhibitor